VTDDKTRVKNELTLHPRGGTVPCKTAIKAVTSAKINNNEKKFSKTIIIKLTTIYIDLHLLAS
jgi:hypothetical protein